MIMHRYAPRLAPPGLWPIANLVTSFRGNLIDSSRFEPNARRLPAALGGDLCRVVRRRERLPRAMDDGGPLDVVSVFLFEHEELPIFGDSRPVGFDALV